MGLPPIQKLMNAGFQALGILLVGCPTAVAADRAAVLPAVATIAGALRLFPADAAMQGAGLLCLISMTQGVAAGSTRARLCAEVEKAKVREIARAAAARFRGGGAGPAAEMETLSEMLCSELDKAKAAAALASSFGG